MIVTLIVAIKDEEDLPSGHKRKKAGDIIAVCPADHKGGTLTRKTHLLLKVDLGGSIATLNDAKKLMIPHFATGELWYPEEMPKISGKRRYNVPITDIVLKAQILGISLDMDKILNNNIDYQPLEKINISFMGMVWDKYLNKKLNTADLVKIVNAGK